MDFLPPSNGSNCNSHILGSVWCIQPDCCLSADCERRIPNSKHDGGDRKRNDLNNKYIDK